MTCSSTCASSQRHSFASYNVPSRLETFVLCRDLRAMRMQVNPGLESLRPRRRIWHCQSLEQQDLDQKFDSIFHLAAEVDLARSSGRTEYRDLERVLDIQQGYSRCLATAELTEKFGVQEQDEQLVVCITNWQENVQVWWNRARIRKPQTFKLESATIEDPTNGGQTCDFCQWETMTATDTFGRVENASCVTASNLFKYAFPCHGLILFKHHHPLLFTAEQVADLLAAGEEWLQRASNAHPMAQWPLFIWNSLPRAGASQFHGHAQVTLTETPTPAARTLLESMAGHEDDNQSSYMEAVEAAYSSVGLQRSLRAENKRAWCYASLAPVKDMETVVVGGGLGCQAFAGLLHGALRALIDLMGVATFNVSILNIKVGPSATQGHVVARIVSRGSLSSKASDFGGLEVFGRASIGHTDPFRVIEALDMQMAGHDGFEFMTIPTLTNTLTLPGSAEAVIVKGVLVQHIVTLLRSDLKEGAC